MNTRYTLLAMPAQTGMYKVFRLRSLVARFAGCCPMLLASPFLGCAIFALAFPVCLHAAPAGVAEPATTFYGKILGTADIQPFLITDGQLAWTIRRADGTDVTLHTKLFAYNQDTFSYRLDVPHSALSVGLSAGGGDVPLALFEQTHRHLSVTLDGDPVTLLGPAGEVFTSAQILRSATYRLDLGVNRHALDTSGDGIPDWWCDKYGFDKQSNIANNVLPSGLTVAQAYALGLDPNADPTVPAPLTEETVVYAGGDTALILEVYDMDTDASNLVYTVIAPPFGTLALLASDGTPGPLDPGATFTQADVLAARVIYRHDTSVSDPGLFAFALSDGDHPPVESAVRLQLYEPAISEVSLRSDLYQLASAGFIVAEGALIDAAGAPAAYALAGVALTGGAADDVLVDDPTRAPGPRVWTGGAGADRFVLTDFSANTLTITDFSLAEGDILDITAFTPPSNVLSEHVTLSGDTLTFDTGLAVVLTGLDGVDLYTLVSGGALLTGLTLPPRISAVATAPVASRNGPVPGVVTFYREGDTGGALTVGLQITGSAQNGVDYQFIPGAVTIPAGGASVAVLVTPYTAGGGTEVVAVLGIQAGAGYLVGQPQSASVTIEPRKPEVGVEAIIPVAVKEGGESGYFLLWRDVAGGASLVVQNTLGGGAARGTDYQTYNFDTGGVMNPTLVNFGANETEKLVEVAVLPSANFADGSKSVTLAPDTSSRYAVMPGYAAAEVVLIDRWDTFEDWLVRGGVSLMGFAPMDTSALFKRYAYGAEPTGDDRSGFPRPVLLSDGMTVRVRQPVGRLGVSYTLSGFTDLADPAGSSVGFTEVLPPKGQPAGPDWRYYRLNANGAQGFIRVDVQ